MKIHFKLIMGNLNAKIGKKYQQMRSVNVRGRLWNEKRQAQIHFFVQNITP